MGRAKYFCLVACWLFISWYPTKAAQVKILPGSAVRGEQLLLKKGCLDCHALYGRDRIHCDAGVFKSHNAEDDCRYKGLWLLRRSSPFQKYRVVRRHQSRPNRPSVSSFLQ
jgi:hypothetical protein